MAGFFDLIYVSQSSGRSMSCAVHTDQREELIGPFPAGESGPKIVAALMEYPELGLTTKALAEDAYIKVHFRNMSRGENQAGQAYPMRLEG